MRNKELCYFAMATIKCFVIIMVIGVFLPKAVDYLLQMLINNSTVYKNSVFVYKLVDNNYNLAYNYILTFYLFFKVWSYVYLIFSTIWEKNYEKFIDKLYTKYKK